MSASPHRATGTPTPLGQSDRLCCLLDPDHKGPCRRVPAPPFPLEHRLAIARALALEHGMPLGFHDEADQLDFDRKACAVLREMQGEQ